MRLLFIYMLLIQLAGSIGGNYRKGEMNLIGKYASPEQSFNHYSSEMLVLKPDSSFSYELNLEFLKMRTNGYWRFSDGYIVLNSGEKKEKILVEERTANLKKSMLFDVRYKDGGLVNYRLCLIVEKDTLCYSNMFLDTLIHNLTNKPSAFYIIDARGIRYPTYPFKGNRSNHFIIKLEENRVFDNERWKLKDMKIQPLGLDGNYSNYFLLKAS